MNIYIGGPVEYNDMQGPAPDGFHVPLYTEWQGLKTIMDGLGLTTGDNRRINLHIPFAGGRRSTNAGLTLQGSYGIYWSSSPYGSDDPYQARNFILNSFDVIESNGRDRAYGIPVRCFKNSYVAPTSSWTIITGTLGSAGIFWNQTEGLISITSNGTTGYTIQDKNLGATSVYNNGNTLTQANMGNMYQWGNNYGFQSTGSVTTSSTQVDASNYGPGNYYNSSTFITGSRDWSSVQNDNLRGGVSQGSGTKSTEVQNIYIGEYTGFHPGNKTMWYLNMNQTDSVFTDAVGHTVNNNGITYNSNGVSEGCGYNHADGKRLYSNFASGESRPSEVTIMCFIKPTGTHYTSDHPMGISLANASTKVTIGIGFNQNNSLVQFNYLREGIAWDTQSYSYAPTNKWHHYALTYNGTTMVGYIDGTQVISASASGSGSGTGPSGGLTVFGRTHPSYTNTIQGLVDEVIVEKKIWTAADIQDYLSNFTYS